MAKAKLAGTKYKLTLSTKEATALLALLGECDANCLTDVIYDALSVELDVDPSLAVTIDDVVFFEGGVIRVQKRD